MEIISASEDGLELKNELVNWGRVKRIFTKNSTILIIEFEKENEIYVAKTLITFNNPEKAKKVLNQVIGLWANGKESNNKSD